MIHESSLYRLSEIEQPVGKLISAPELLRGEWLDLICAQQFNFAEAFYNLPRNNYETNRMSRRKITRNMAQNQVDLALGTIMDNSGKFDGIAMLPILRASLEMVAEPVVGHLSKRMKESGIANPVIDLWAMGLGRVTNSATGTANVYFEHYGSKGFKNPKVLIFEWGMGVGQTVVTCIKRLLENGIPPSSVIVIPFLSHADHLEGWIKKHGDSDICNTVRVVSGLTGATIIGSHGNPYFGELIDSSGKVHSLTPIDWGAAQWGMEDLSGTIEERRKQTEDFMRYFSELYPDVKAGQLDVLKKFYLSKYQLD